MAASAAGRKKSPTENPVTNVKKTRATAAAQMGVERRVAGERPCMVASRTTRRHNAAITPRATAAPGSMPSSNMLRWSLVSVTLSGGTASRPCAGSPAMAYSVDTRIVGPKSA